MKLQLFRNATLKLEMAGQVLLTDPCLAPKGTRPSFAGKSANPLVELPIPPQAVLAGIDAALLSHLHSDHFDPLARELLPKATPLLCQPADAPELHGLGFIDVTPVEEPLTWKGITLTRTGGQHGSGAVLDEMGTVSGFILQAPGEPTVYWVGDTIWCPEVEGAIARFQPDVILTHSSGALWGAGVPIVMDAAQTIRVCQAAPQAVVVAVHMEAFDHGTVTRAALREAAQAAGIAYERLRIPQDGETLVFTR